MKTITLQIGNSDDKLAQNEWSEFVSDIAALLASKQVTIFFFGCSHGAEKWQNAAWVFGTDNWTSEQIKSGVSFIRTAYRQDSAAWTEAETQFI